MDHALSLNNLVSTDTGAQAIVSRLEQPTVPFPGHVDLHFHLIPGIDDGPANVDEAVEMLLLAHTDGTRRIVATPHMFLPPFDNNDTTKVREAFWALTAELEKRAHEMAFLRDMQIELGAENYISPEFFDALERRDLITMGESEFALIEFSGYMPFDQIAKAVDRIHRSGLGPILAHVERYRVFLEKPQRLQALANAGCLVQVNSRSLIGRWGSRQRRFAIQLLKSGVVDIVSSDAHNTGSRRPDLGRAAAVLRKKFSPDQISSWCGNKARQILSVRVRSPPSATQPETDRC